MSKRSASKRSGPGKEYFSPSLLFTCEHGGNRIPAPYRALFAAHQALLNSHRGFDSGALIMAQALAAAFEAPLVSSSTSRLLVDLNRSLGHRHLHWEPVRQLPAGTRREIIDRYYLPYRRKVEQWVAEGIARNGRVIHISCHSFTPELDGEFRDADIGLLYDAARHRESAFCAAWKQALNAARPDCKVRRNYPYRGNGDGLTTALRHRFAPDAYLGIELELNQRNLASPPRQWIRLRRSIMVTLNTVLPHATGRCPDVRRPLR